MLRRMSNGHRVQSCVWPRFAFRIYPSVLCSARYPWWKTYGGQVSRPVGRKDNFWKCGGRGPYKWIAICNVCLWGHIVYWWEIFVYQVVLIHTEGVGNADNETLAGLGTIVVDFYNVQVLDGSTKTRHFPGGDSAGGKRSINEKTKKALITHSVK